MPKRSQKHHYLPRHYLKGFTNDDGGFFVYDKQEDKIFLTNPDSTFFQKNLNTIDLPKDGPSDFLEKLYADTELYFWSSLDKIRNSKSNETIQVLDRMYLFFFLLNLHWRLPSNTENIEQLSKEMLPTHEGILDFLNLYTQDDSGNKVEAPEHFKKALRESEAFKKVTRLVATFVPFQKNKDWPKDLENWKFFYTGDQQSWHMVGDRPIITDGVHDHDPLKCLSNFVFPVSGRILLVNYKEALNQDLSEEFIISYNMAIIDHAERFVACQNEGFLKILTEEYKKYVILDKTKEMVPKMFKTLRDK